MQRHEAIEIAKINRAHYRIANLEFTMKVWAVITDIEAREQMQRDLDKSYGYKHGWYSVGEFCFGEDELSGVPYDATQGGWAFI